jgi:hypothetical protein
MKKLTIELTDKQHCMISRIAKEEKRKLQDFICLTISDGLGSFFCERAIHIEKKDDEYTTEEKKQLATNEKLEKSKGWKNLDWDERRAKGYDHVCHYLSNCSSGQKDFIDELSVSIEANIYAEKGDA